jgi:hypothetical protein
MFSQTVLFFERLGDIGGVSPDRCLWTLDSCDGGSC